MRKRIRLFIGAFAAVALGCSPAYADAGLPMLALTWPVAIDDLIPVILIEAYVFKRSGFPFLWSLKWNAIANVASTLIGIPLAWGAYFALELAVAYSHIPWPKMRQAWDNVLGVLLTAPWLPPWNPWPSWIVPAAYLILLVPFFFVSWRLESSVIRWFNAQYDRRSISRACLRANLASYALLTLFPISLFWVSYPRWLFWEGRLFWF